MVESFIAVALLWLAAVGLAVFISHTRYKSKRILTSRRILFGSTFLAAFTMYLPIYYATFNDIVADRVFKSAIMSVYHTLRLFIMEGDFELIQNVANGMTTAISMLYTTFWVVIFIVAPLLTFEVILSIFKNISAYRRYILKFYKDTYVFSELNEKSLALAKSISGDSGKNLIVFTGVGGETEQENQELAEQAQELGAICFKKDITAVNFRLHSKKSTISFFAICENESESINRSFSLLKSYADRDNTMLYVFSTSTEGELIMAAASKGKVKLRRIKDVRSLIYRALYDMEEGVINPENGKVKPDIFMNARPLPDGTRQIGAVVVGCGQHGTEMIKALTWFCQMDGYRVSIDVFDIDEKAESKFAALCPELMCADYNGVYKPGEAQYKITFHSGIDVSTVEFSNEIKKLSDTTYVFTALGTDEDNITAAVKLRTLYEQIRIHPIIQSVVYSTEKKQSLSGVKNFKGQPYDIDFVGDLNTLYSKEVIIDSELEQDALARHLKYGCEEDFWAYEYNYRSSMASALHMRARIACKINGADKKEEELTTEQRDIIEVLEHRRWNAYMRSEGYIYSGSKDKESRNDLGKMHHDLVVFDELSEEDKRKDSRVGSK